MAQQLELAWDHRFNPDESLSQTALSECDMPRVSASEGSDGDSIPSSQTVTDRQSVSPVPAAVNGLQLPHEAAWESPNPPSEQQRILQLEQALYQCQLYIDELKQQLVDQAFLEEQLATTESFSHIQKQAIEALKSQVADQVVLSSELDGLRQKMQLMQTQWVEAETIARQKETDYSILQLQSLQTQSELEQLRDKNAQLVAQLDALQSSMVQETQQRIIAQKTTERLRTELRNRETALRSLETQLKQSEGMLAQREDMIAALQDLSRPGSQKDQAIQGLSSTLLKAQRRIADLEGELSNQSILQVQLQHTTQELEQSAQTNQSRSDQLEHQVNDLQEQVLRQAQQASEYETAIQHWKTRSLEAEEWTAQVAKLWDMLSAEQRLSETMAPDLTYTLTGLARWFKGSRGNLLQDDVAPLSPRELLGFRPRRPSF
ncbi:MAG: hypothetical protein WCD18_17785 [Thermosynechococcaceae cyanobacterium]